MYVVAGASGRTGRVVAETLLGRGKPVRVIVRDRAKGEPFRARGAEVAVASLDDAPALERALAGATGFYTLLPEDLSRPDFHAHRRAVIAATAAAARSHRPHVVLLSGTPAYLDARSGLALGLHVMEQALRETGAKITALRATSLLENVLLALPAARSEGVFPSFVPADAPFPSVAARDVGRFAAQCLLEPPATSETVDLIGPICSNRQLAEKLGSAIGKTLRVVEIPPAAQLDALRRAGLPDEFAQALTELYACLNSGEVSPHGDRMVAATSTLDEILPGLLSGGG